MRQRRSSDPSRTRLDSAAASPRQLSLAGWRSREAASISAGLLFLGLSGLWTYLAPFSVATLLLLLAHATVGLVVGAPAARYAQRHWVTWFRQAPTAAMVLGYGLLAAVATSTTSGLVVTWQAGRLPRAVRASLMSDRRLRRRRGRATVAKELAVRVPRIAWCLCLLAPAAWAVAAHAQTVGANQRISDMGGVGRAEYDARYPEIAYNSRQHRYLVVWWGDDDDTGANQEFRIFGQLIDAATGSEIGGDFNISEVEIDPELVSESCVAVAYNDSRDEFFVAWVHSSGTEHLRGLRVDGATGLVLDNSQILTPERYVQTQGDRCIDVAYNGQADEYLVVFGAAQVDREQIVAQRVRAADAAPQGELLQVSDMGTGAIGNFSGRYPAVAYNPDDDEYLVVWQGEDNIGGLMDDEEEIFGQRLDGSTGAELGADDFRISTVEGTGDPLFGASRPDVVYNANANQYLVVFRATDDIFGDNTEPQPEIWMRRLASDGSGVDADERRISTMGSLGSTLYEADYPRASLTSNQDEYLVVWHGEDFSGGLVEGEFEIFGQRLDAATGDSLGSDDFRISFMGGTGSTAYGGYAPAVAFGGLGNHHVVWYGSSSEGGLVSGEYEIFAAAVQTNIFGDGFESGNVAAWSSVAPLSTHGDATHGP